MPSWAVFGIFIQATLGCSTVSTELHIWREHQTLYATGLVMNSQNQIPPLEILLFKFRRGAEGSTHMKSRVGYKRFTPWLYSLLQEWVKRHDFDLDLVLN